MAKKFVELTRDEIRTGQVITERAKGHAAALEALKATELDYMEQLRAKYKLGPEYLVFDWMLGFERDEEVTADDKDN